MSPRRRPDTTGLTFYGQNPRDRHSEDSARRDEPQTIEQTDYSAERDGGGRPGARELRRREDSTRSAEAWKQYWKRWKRFTVLVLSCLVASASTSDLPRLEQFYAMGFSVLVARQAYDEAWGFKTLVFYAAFGGAVYYSFLYLMGSVLM